MNVSDFYAEGDYEDDADIIPEEEIDAEILARASDIESEQSKTDDEEEDEDQEVDINDEDDLIDKKSILSQISKPQRKKVKASSAVIEARRQAIYRASEHDLTLLIGVMLSMFKEGWETTFEQKPKTDDPNENRKWIIRMMKLELTSPMSPIKLVKRISAKEEYQIKLCEMTYDEEWFDNAISIQDYTFLGIPNISDFLSFQKG